MKVRLSGLCSLLIAFMWGTTTSLWAGPRERTMRLDELFQWADRASLALKSAESQSKVVDAAVAVAKNGLLPDISFTASATYHGNAWMADRDFSHGQNLDSPHFGNNFALEVVQVVYAGGAIKHGTRACRAASATCQS